jgi:guanine deaminase
VNGVSADVYSAIPDEYAHLPVKDFSHHLIIPGLVDLHVHAPQFSYRALGMDLELLDWLNTHAFPEEARFSNLDYAKKSYSAFINNILRGPNTRLCIFGTIHNDANLLLMDMLEDSGLVAMVGKVNMDRNSPPYLREVNAKIAADNTRAFIEKALSKRFKNVTPIITPRFIPSCSDELMFALAAIQKEYSLAVQSHLSENKKEIAWVKELCPHSKTYADAYKHFGLFGAGVPTVMAHCVWSDTEHEIPLLKECGVFVAHCPQSNTNLASGIAPVRKFLDEGINVGLGCDVAGGAHTSIFRAMTDAIQVSKLRRFGLPETDRPLTVEEAFYMATIGGGKFFAPSTGSFEQGFEFDAVVIDDSPLSAPYSLNVKERLEKVIYLPEECRIAAKFVRGEEVFALTP